LAEPPERKILVTLASADVARKKSSERWNSPAMTSATDSMIFSTSCGTTPCSSCAPPTL
jgi:hypothetical protein